VTYPECEKLAASSAERDTVNAFIDWLGSQGLHVCEPTGSNVRPYLPVGGSPDDLALAYLGIDQKVLEYERRDMLRSLQA